ncbi:MAG: hypothetical protein ISR01_06250 [Chitinophagales bacterium]|nr:hypothetical protein [Chitinophagales bacterium]
MNHPIPYLFIVIFLLQSCDKENDDFSLSPKVKYSKIITQKSPYTHPTAPIGTTVNFHLLDRRIVLENSNDFSILMWSLADEEISKFENDIGFTSLMDLKPKEQDITDIKKVLSPDGLIQINPWVFKLDFEEQLIYVLPVTHISQIDDLKEKRTSNSNIQVFTFMDDVWQLLEEGEENIQTDSNIKRCREAKAKNKQVYATTSICNCTPYYWQKTTISVRYNKFGIWETVKAFYYTNFYNVYGQSNNQYTNSSLLSGTIHYHFDERCGISYYGTRILPSGQFSQTSYTLRSNKKPLERNKSVVNMTVNTSYIVSPPEPAQSINTLLNNF